MSRLRSKKGKGANFVPQNGALVEHRKVGVWDLYVERDAVLSYFPTSWRIEEYAELLNDIPYLWRTLRDVATLAWPLLLLYVALTLMISLVPALNLWFSAQLVNIVQVAVDQRVVDTNLLIQIAGGRVLCAAVENLLSSASRKVSIALNWRIRRFYSAHIFRSMARLDVPTWDDPVASAQIEAVVPKGQNAVAWVAITSIVQTGSTLLRLFSQTAVLTGVLWEQRDGLLLSVLSFASNSFTFFNLAYDGDMHGAWAATTRDNDFIRMEGLKQLVSRSKHRKEVVAGGLAECLTAEYSNLVDRLGDSASDFWSAYMSRQSDRSFHPVRLLRLPLSELPQIVFTLRAVQQPSSIPVSLASLHLMQRTSGSFIHSVRLLLQQTGNVSGQLSALRKLYEAGNITNQVVDGTVPFPQNTQSIRDGICLEFRDVSFRYPGSEDYALRNISFRVAPGQLCVIIGSNGSGKSTILKLMARIYDPTEGTIFLDDQDIKVLRLADLRRAMAILFQDYTHFPLSIRENIALGDPTRMHDEAAIEEAARLGGASELIAHLPNGFDTYLERPVRDLFSGLPDGTTNLFGRKFDNGNLRTYVDTPIDHGLSGGQMQRLAVARTFMRSSSAEQGVGLLLFDEPSASLDPTAEHDLFSRLRELRGNKTMIFSTHRFGNLTRHADLILYMNNSVIVEAGTHEDLLKVESSDYARLWRIQAEAFL
ncbi:HlyB/MsbA family ABC transporter [Russula earlei]|uniref:HlyB/MsbA family ABC transporter n=1 Tax=Russula earlei TaxID=71964 RepID=A0ACC0U8K7_9AGAM|nr:HlyB/MsbA family ABC transporter [Russula earlei]